MSLLSAGFKHRQVEDAMSSTVPFGGDLVDTLDWLCLNTTNGTSHCVQLMLALFEPSLRE